MIRTICLHGPESTGKTTLIPRLAEHFGTDFVHEYGRTYAEKYGTDFTMADLVEIARTHDEMTRAALITSPPPLFLDTDPLMSAVWADMLFGHRDPWFDAWDATADFYLLLDIDLPWVEDGTRMFGTRASRQRFFDLSRAELERRGVDYTIVGGSGEARFENALAAISDKCLSLST
jgi:NadR type nicotinamide-nucleotide adenylyltransferase